MLLTVHDELVLEVPADERDATEPIVREVMEHVTELRVPLVVDIGFGPNWAEAEVAHVASPHRLCATFAVENPSLRVVSTPKHAR